MEAMEPRTISVIVHGGETMVDGAHYCGDGPIGERSARKRAHEMAKERGTSITILSATKFNGGWDVEATLEATEQRRCVAPLPVDAIGQHVYVTMPGAQGAGRVEAVEGDRVLVRRDDGDPSEVPVEHLEIDEARARLCGALATDERTAEGVICHLCAGHAGELDRITDVQAASQHDTTPEYEARLRVSGERLAETWRALGAFTASGGDPYSEECGRLTDAYSVAKAVDRLLRPASR